MRFKKFASLLCIMLLLVTMSLAGCSKTEGDTTTTPPDTSSGESSGTTPVPTEPKTLTLGWEREPQGMDIHQYYIPEIRMAALAVWEPLIREHQGQVVPAAAEKWEISEDGLVYTFHLREGMKWSDGEPLLAQHYVDSVKRHGDPNFPSPMGGTYLAMIKNGTEYNAGKVGFEEVGVKALDDLTVEYTLAYPMAYFMDQLKNAAYLPIRLDYTDQYGETYGGSVDSMVYCGPYVLSEWKREERMVMDKNPDYWAADTLAQIDQVVVEVVVSSETRVLMFEQGDLDYTVLMTNQVENYKDNKYFTTYNAGNVYGLMFQTGNKFLKNENLRNAISYSLDRQGICDSLFFGAYAPGNRMVPNGTLGGSGTDGSYWGDTKDVSAWDPGINKEKAQELLAKALEELNCTVKDIDIYLMTGDGEQTRLMAEYVQDAVKSTLGIDISVKLLPNQQRWADEVAGIYELNISGFSVACNDPYEYLKGYLDGGNYLHTGVQEQEWYPEYESLMMQARDETDTKTRAQLLGQAEQIFLDGCIFAPIYHGTRIFLLRNDAFEGIESNRSGMELNWIFAK